MVIREDYLQKLWKYKDKKIIKVLAGMRRSGKSAILEMMKNELLKNDVSKEQIIMMNFESIEYEKYLEYDVLYNHITSRLNKGKMNYVFLDEIQNVKSFEKCVNSLFLRDDVDIYITGSNSYMLSGSLRRI